jgi:hypothetical protein
MNEERLLKTAELLEHLALNRQLDVNFCMSYWGTYNSKSVRDHPCGTSACAIGFAALDPWFQKEGLELYAFTEVGDDPDCKLSSIEEFNDFLRAHPRAECTPKFEGHVDMSAVRTFYGISYEDANCLFGINNPDDPAKIAAEIRALVTSHKEVATP